MSVSPREVLGLLIGMLLCVEIGLAVEENKHAFEILCSLIRLTDSTVKLTPTAAQPEDIRSDLIKLNMTTADDAWFDLFSGSSEDAWTKVKEKEPFKTWVTKDSSLEGMYNAWNQAKKELIEDAKEAKEFLRPPASPRRSVANYRIRRLWQRFLEEEKARAKLTETMRKTAEEVEKKFTAARTGKEDSPNVTAASFDAGGSGRSNFACGGATGQAATGTSLANDLVCVCTAVSGQTSHSNDVCKTGLQPTKVDWSSSGSSDGPTQFKVIFAACPPNPQNFKANAHTIRERLAKFWTHLGKNVASAVTFESAYTLGGADSGVTTAGACTGTGNNEAICVNYKKNLLGTAAGGIPWVKRLEEAAAKLHEFEEEGRKFHALNARAESLRDAAWAAYEETKVPDPTVGTTEGTTPSTTPTQLGTAAPGSDEKVDEKSSVTITHFILPWILLI